LCVRESTYGEYVSSFWIVEPSRRGGGTYCLHAYTFHTKRGSTWVCNFPHKARFHANLCV